MCLGCFLFAAFNSVIYGLDGTQWVLTNYCLSKGCEPTVTVPSSGEIRLGFTDRTWSASSPGGGFHRVELYTAADTIQLESHESNSVPISFAGPMQIHKQGNTLRFDGAFGTYILVSGKDYVTPTPLPRAEDQLLGEWRDIDGGIWKFQRLEQQNGRYVVEFPRSNGYATYEIVNGNSLNLFYASGGE